MKENDINKDCSGNERSYVLSRIFAKSNNIRASLKFKYLINKLGKSFSDKTALSEDKEVI